MVLAGVLFPAVQMVRDSARRISCQNNLRQLGLAILAYGGDNQGMLPPLSLDNQGTGKWYTNLLNDAGVVEISTWAYSDASGWGDVRSGVFRCPSCQPAQMYNGGGYGFLWTNPTGHRQASTTTGIGPRLGVAPAGQILAGDAALGPTSSFPGWSYIGIVCPLCGTWTTAGNGGAGRHIGLANCVYLDGHVDARTVADLKGDAVTWGH